MSNMQAVFSPEHGTQLHQMGLTAFGKRVHARIQSSRERRYHPLFGTKRYVVFVEHDTPFVAENGEKGEPVLGVIVTAPKIRAAQRKAIEKTPFHIRRFLHWKELPLYPIAEEAA